MRFQADHFHHLQFPFTSAESHVYEHDDVDDYGYGEEEEDLGYYEDGVKRTLTDEQIKIFRHSEIHSLLRERQRLREEEEDGDQDQDEEILPDNPLVGEEQPLAAKSTESADNKRASATDTESAGESVEERPAKQPRNDPIAEAYSGRKMVSYSDD